MKWVCLGKHDGAEGLLASSLQPVHLIAHVPV